MLNPRVAQTALALLRDKGALSFDEVIRAAHALEGEKVLPAVDKLLKRDAKITQGRSVMTDAIIFDEPKLRQQDFLDAISGLKQRQKLYTGARDNGIDPRYSPFPGFNVNQTRQQAMAPIVYWARPDIARIYTLRQLGLI